MSRQSLMSSSGENMEAGGKSLPDGINLSTFPAKLWRLINDPTNKAIWWDSLGETVVIDRRLFEEQFLSCSPVGFHIDGFYATNFSSLVRQLNLYGFKKIRSHAVTTTEPTYLYFQSPYFKQNRPDLVVKLKRLTVDNRAKLQAGLGITTRAPTRYSVLHAVDGGSDTNLKTGSASLLFSKHQHSARPYSLNRASVTHLPSGTGAPPQFLMKGYGGAFLPFSAADKMMPAYFRNPSSGQDSTALQGLMEPHTAPVFPSFSLQQTYFQSVYFPPVGQCCSPQQSGLQEGIFSSSYYMPYPPSGVDEPNLMAEEMLPTPPYNCAVKVDCPEEAPSFSEAATGACGTTWWSNGCNTTKASPFPNGPAVGSGSSFCPMHREGGACVVPLPEHVLQGARSEVTSQGRRDTVIKYSTVGQTYQK